MIGVDTNILLRLSDKTSPKQSARVRALVASQGDSGCFVNEIVLVEYAWTLKRIYKQTRDQILAKLQALLDSREFELACESEVRRALIRYAAGPADFADYLLAEINRTHGCSQTPTFDDDVLRSGEPFAPVPQLAQPT
jgi:predicted nucleic-acid-binding protein